MKKVGIVMGSDSDLPILRKAMDTLDSLGKAVFFTVSATTSKGAPFTL